MKIAQIAAIAAYLPKERLDNAELVKAFPKWTEKKLEAKLGIVERPISADGETAVDLASAACRRLFDAGFANPDEIDFVLLCTQSPITSSRPPRASFRRDSDSRRLAAPSILT